MRRRRDLSAFFKDRRYYLSLLGFLVMVAIAAFIIYRGGDEQKEIANYLDAKCAEIDRLIAKKEQLVKELESYKKSLIYEVVTGKREV